MAIRINISFPSVMKMEFHTYIEVEEPLSLDKVREKVFESFWRSMEPFSPRGIHGVPSEVILQDLYKQEVSNDIELRSKIKESNNFTVVFKGH